ncbi:RidA family protein [Asaia krungthepensis]|nr:endoribonuclease L-PSP [Asaia krungthepensis]
MHDHSSPPSRPVLQDSVTYYGVTGLGPDGKPPESLIEECQNALARIRDILATHDLVPEDIVHLAYMIPDSVTFSACQRVIAEALGPARPAMTLRLKPSFDVPGQRLEFNFIASA